VLRGLLHQHLEQGGLRHDTKRAIAELLDRLVDARDRQTVQMDQPILDHRGRKRKHPVAQPHLIESAESGRHERFTAKHAGRVALAFDEHHLEPVSGQKQGQRRSGRATADNQDSHDLGMRSDIWVNGIANFL